jgi:hypothetical protein
MPFKDRHTSARDHRANAHIGQQLYQYAMSGAAVNDVCCANTLGDAPDAALDLQEGAQELTCNAIRAHSWHSEHGHTPTCRQPCSV